MSVRYYFCLAEKSVVDAVCDLDEQNFRAYARERGLEENDGYIRLFGYDHLKADSILNSTEIFEFGRLSDERVEQILECGKPLFSVKEVFEMFDDNYPYVVGKDGLLEAISMYQKFATDYYEKLYTEFLASHDPEPLLNLIKKKRLRLNVDDLVNLEEDEKSKWSVTPSWEYEHNIFNLVHILKMVDWEKYTLIFYAN